MIFSVIVPFLDEALYIDRCLRSLTNQDFDKNEYELIFIDNGSRDVSSDIVRKYPGVILIEEEVADAYAARNKALGVAQGTIIAFTDADCEVSSSWLTEIHRGMLKTGATIVLGKRLFPRPISGALQLFEDYENAKIEYVLERGPKKRYFGFTNNMAVDSSAFRKLGLFLDPGMAGDMEFIQRCLDADPDARVLFLPGMEIVHLEITRLRIWLDKMKFYGTLIRRTPRCRPLSSGMKWAVFRRLCRRKNFRLVRQLHFLLLLVLGNLYFIGGGLRGLARPSPSSRRPPRTVRKNRPTEKTTNSSANAAEL